MSDKGDSVIDMAAIRRLTEFVAAIKSEEAIWNPNHKDYNDANAVHECWVRLETKLGKPMEELKIKKESLFKLHENDIKDLVYFKKHGKFPCPYTTFMLNPFFNMVDEFLGPICGSKVIDSMDTDDWDSIDDESTTPHDNAGNNVADQIQPVTEKAAKDSLAYFTEALETNMRTLDEDTQRAVMNTLNNFMTVLLRKYKIHQLKKQAKANGQREQLSGGYRQSYSEEPQSSSAWTVMHDPPSCKPSTTNGYSNWNWQWRR